MITIDVTKERRKNFGLLSFIDLVQHLVNVASKYGEMDVKPLYPHTEGRLQALQACGNIDKAHHQNFTAYI